MDQSTHDIRRANWLTIINQCQTRPSNMSVRQWLAENNNGLTIELSNDISEGLLSRLLQEVVHA